MFKFFCLCCSLLSSKNVTNVLYSLLYFFFIPFYLVDHSSSSCFLVLFLFSSSLCLPTFDHLFQYFGLSFSEKSEAAVGRISSGFVLNQVSNDWVAPDTCKIVNVGQSNSWGVDFSARKQPTTNIVMLCSVVVAAIVFLKFLLQTSTPQKPSLKKKKKKSNAKQESKKKTKKGKKGKKKTKTNKNRTTSRGFED
jgi:hypothetical protein